MDVELKVYAEGAATGGDGLSHVQRKQRVFHEINQANNWGKKRSKVTL